MTSSCEEFVAAFAINEFNVCIKDADKTVLIQDDRCAAICGNRIGTRCVTGCMALYDSDENPQWKNQGSRVYKSTLVGKEYFDIHILCGDRNIITVLVPLKKQQSKALSFYQDMGLTRREMEVISLVIQGCSNKCIIGQLAISKATLKSHLNSIYRKTRENGAKPKYIPANRITN